MWKVAHQNKDLIFGLSPPPPPQKKRKKKNTEQKFYFQSYLEI